MAVAWNLVTIAAAAAIVWIAMQWMARRAAPAPSRPERLFSRNLSGARNDLAMFTPPQHDPCHECEGVGGISGVSGIRMCPMCDGTGIRVFS